MTTTSVFRARLSAANRRTQGPAAAGSVQVSPVDRIRYAGRYLLGVTVALACGSQTLSAQPIELVGTRALGMGGAFVAVANDSSGTWWNPAGLAAGPFLDVALARSSVEVADRLPAARAGTWSFALGTPPFGFSYYRFRLTDAAGIDPIAQDRADRQETGEGIGVRSLSVSQFGVTILQTLIDGVHVGSTVKYVRGTPRGAMVPGGAVTRESADSALDLGDALEGGDAEGLVDLDVGAIAVVGGFRGGIAVRNVREPEFGTHRLPRQVRIGAAFDGEAIGMAPLVLALDADLRRYDAGWGGRRMAAVGAEHWLRPRRIAIRGGTRVNTVDDGGAVVTGGASVAVRAGLFVDAHAAFGTDEAESGWSVAARVSF